MRLKQGVSLAGLKPEALAGMMLADEVFKAAAIDCVVTSGTEGKHSPGSLHYVGLAFDLRSRALYSLLDGVVQDLKGALGAEFDVVVAPTHIHIEFQPKKNRS